MGMVVFSGMLIATILGVLLIPMLYDGRQGDRRDDAATVPATPPRLAAGHAGEPLRWRGCGTRAVLALALGR
jgi:hypothetical protein